MSKKAKKKARAKSDDDRDDGTVMYDESEDEDDWVEDENTATTGSASPEALVGTNQEINPDEPVYGTPEETRDLPEEDRSTPPLRPEDQEPEPYGTDISPNQSFNVKAGSMPEDRPDHDKPIGEKGKDAAYGYDVDPSQKDKRKEK